MNLFNNLSYATANILQIIHFISVRFLSACKVTDVNKSTSWAGMSGSWPSAVIMAKSLPIFSENSYNLQGRGQDSWVIFVHTLDIFLWVSSWLSSFSGSHRKKLMGWFHNFFWQQQLRTKVKGEEQRKRGKRERWGSEGGRGFVTLFAGGWRICL